ncbi:MAG: sulfite exporter TauE/SafE family protein, partial [Marmoricola sp.]
RVSVVDLADLGLLALAGVGAGVIGSTAGLASLVSYPALLAVGLPPVTANVTNTLGLIGSSIGSVAGSRPELTGMGATLRRGLPVVVVAGAVGATLLLLGPPGVFESVVPVLVAGASLLLLLSPRVRRAGLRRRAVGTRRPDGGVVVTVLVFLACVYGGYFGAAAGVMILAVLLSRTDRSLPVSNALKNVFLGAANATAAVVFAFRAPVAWPAVPPLLVGCVLGGWLGPTVVRRLPEAALRWVVGVAGLLLAARLAFVG